MPLNVVINGAILVSCLVLAIVFMAVAYVYRRPLHHALAESPCLEGIVPKPSDAVAKISPRLAEAQMEASTAEAPAVAELDPPPLADNLRDDDSRQNDVRQRLKERISGVTADERALTARQAKEALDAAAESAEATAAAEAAVARVGSPGAALLAAVSRSPSAVEVRALLLRGADPDASFLDRSALAMAARTCSPEVVKVLIDANATLDMKDGRGWTPLMHAIDAHTLSSSREAVVSMLLDAGALVDVFGTDLRGPLDLIEAREKEQRNQTRPAIVSAGSGRGVGARGNRITSLLREKSGTFMVGSGAAPSVPLIETVLDSV